MNELVMIQNEQVVTDSRSIAEHFEKQHKHVLEAIENIKAENSAVTPMFYKTTYKAGTGKNYPMYLMNRDGFSLLVMGFTGKKALEWKIKYIEAFNAMEKQLKTVPKITPNPKYRTRKIATALKDMDDTAKVLEKTFACKHGMALATAMTMISQAYGFDPSPMRNLIPAEENPSYLTARNIAEKLGIVFKTGYPDGSKVNKALEAMGLQEKKQAGKKGKWVLTKTGMDYGEMKPFDTGKHSDYQPVWTPKAVELVKEYYKVEPPDNVISFNDARKGLKEDA